MSSLDSVGGRYEVGELLGTGGAATVHRANDTRTGRLVALKRLRPTSGLDRARQEELFRQEFHTLAHLSHPNIVAVYDYGVDGETAYYTMELLDGGDLVERVPLDWMTACRVARDICSALSLVHSRRLVFRDLSPRNIRCTSDGTAKLLDFGALAPMGRTRLFVGTPAFASPEAANLQSIDARTDLYSLGATLYFALTGRRPYAAASVQQLLSAFATPPAPAGQYVANLPKELDGLVAEMMQLEPSLRPVTAAEVMERLGAIAGLDSAEHRLVSKAYLSTPTLIGRDGSLERFRRRLARARTGSGCALLVEGPRGSGRSRFLDACVLEAKLSGATVLRAEAADSVSGEYGPVLSIAAQLLDANPEGARAAAGPVRTVLSGLLPELRDDGDASEQTRGAVDHTVLQPALRTWFTRAARQKPLVVAMDDVQVMDLPSASLIALLAREASSHPLVVLTSRPTADGSAEVSKAIELLESNSQPVSIGPLSLKRTERLVRALFGEVPNVEMAASRIHAVSGGLPRDVMRLAQHLVDAGVARYDAGAWVLPQRLGEHDLPADMSEALSAQVAELSPGARALAHALALAPDGLYSFDECVVLGGAEDGSAAVKSLDELVQAQLVTISSRDYGLASGLREALRNFVDDATLTETHARIASVLERRRGEEIRTAEHLIAAGREQRGLDVLLAFSERSAQTRSNMEAFTQMLQALPDGWLEVFDRAIGMCASLGRPRKDLLTLLIRVTGLVSQLPILPIDPGAYFDPLFAQLRHDTGLDLWQAAVGAPDPGARLQAALAGAAARHARGESVFDPKTAIAHLGRLVAAASGVVSSYLAVDMPKILPPLSPFAPLAPALSAWQALIDGLGARITGRTDRARALYEKQLVRLAAPEHGGLDETYHRAQQLGIALVLGTIEAAMGVDATLDRARELETSPLYEINGKRIRMLYHLWQGELAEAERLRSEAEVLVVVRARRQTNEAAHLPRELQVHALSEDLTRVKRTIAAIEPLRSARGWIPVLHRGRAAYELIRGNVDKALAEIETSLAAMDPEGHPVWADAAAAHVTILLAADRAEDARRIGEEYVAESTRREVGYEACYIRMPLAVAHARLGTADAALRHCGGVMSTFEALGSRGLNLGLTHEARARVALELGDMDGFARFAGSAAEHLHTNKNPALAAKHQRLMREAQRRGRAHTTHRTGSENDADVASVLHVLSACTSPEDRLSGALALLLDRAGATEGILLCPDSGHLVVRARVGNGNVPPELIASTQKLWEEQCSLDQETEITDGSALDTKLHAHGDRTYHSILMSHEVSGGLALTGIALVSTVAGGAFRNPARLAMAVSRLVIGDQSAVVVGT